MQLISLLIMISSLLKTNGFLVGRASFSRYSRPSNLNIRLSSAFASSDSSFFDNTCDSEEETRLFLKDKTEVKARIKAIGPLGAFVEVLYDHDNLEDDSDEKEESEANKYLPKRQIEGLINMQELKLYRDYLKHQSEVLANEEEANEEGDADSLTFSNKANIFIGDIITAHIHNIREDGKVAVGFRPRRRERVFQARDLILDKLKASETKVLPVGDKSDSKLIASYFPGVSKKQFKTAVGGLFKDGYVIPAKDSITLIPKSQREKKIKELKKKSKETVDDSLQGPSPRFEKSPVKEMGTDDEVDADFGVKPKMIFNYMKEDGDGPSQHHQFLKSLDETSVSASSLTVAPRILKKRVPYGVGIDSVYITGLSFKTKEKHLVRWIESMIPMAKVVQIKDFLNEDGRASGKAIIQLEINQAELSKFKHQQEEAWKKQISKASEETDEAYISSVNLTSEEDHTFDTLHEKTVVELKEMLRSKGLKTTGVKQELISRLSMQNKEMAPSVNEAMLSFDDKYDEEEDEKEGEEEEVEEEEEVVIEDVVSDVCDLNDSILDHRPVKVRPFFPPRTSRTHEPTSTWIAKEFENELQQNKVMTKKVVQHKEEYKEGGEPIKRGRKAGVFDESDLFFNPSSSSKEERSSSFDKGGSKSNSYSAVESESTRGRLKDDLFVKSNKREESPYSSKRERNNQDHMSRQPSSNEYRLARLSGSMKRGKGAKGPSLTPVGRHKNNVCVFFGNLPYNLPQLELAEEIESVVGEGAIVEMRASPYGDYCHVDFKNEEHAAVAVRELDNFVVNNRPLKVDYAAKGKDKEFKK